MWAMSPNLRIKLGKRRFWGKRSHFPGFSHKREREKEKKKETKLLSSIYRVLSVEISWVKNKSSFTRQGLRVGTENMGFRRGFK